MATSLAHENEIDLLLERKEELANGVVMLTMRHPSGADLPEWAPGAHIDLVLADELTRQYSLCSDPADRAILQVAVLREPTSRGGSAQVHDSLNAGDTIRVRGPRNHFPLREAKRYLFIAGGIGITPLLPMIAQVDAARSDWQLLYGGRSRASMAFRDLLEERYPSNVSIRPADEVGLLDLSLVIDEPSTSADDLAVYCCGPEPLLAAVEVACSEKPYGTLQLERFAAKPSANDGSQKTFEVLLAQTGSTLEVPADQSILDVVEAAGIQVMVSCQEGVCGTCETGVLDGVPDHRDSVLTEDERMENTSMMICVSRSRSARLVLDL